jgi:hypothetical protein
MDITRQRGLGVKRQELSYVEEHGSEPTDFGFRTSSPTKQSKVREDYSELDQWGIRIGTAFVCLTMTRMRMCPLREHGSEPTDFGFRTSSPTKQSKQPRDQLDEKVNTIVENGVNLFVELVARLLALFSWRGSAESKIGRFRPHILILVIVRQTNAVPIRIPHWSSSE